MKSSQQRDAHGGVIWISMWIYLYFFFSAYGVCCLQFHEFLFRKQKKNELMITQSHILQTSVAHQVKCARIWIHLLKYVWEWSLNGILWIMNLYYMLILYYYYCTFPYTLIRVTWLSFCVFVTTNFYNNNIHILGNNNDFKNHLMKVYMV